MSRKGTPMVVMPEEKFREIIDKAVDQAIKAGQASAKKQERERFNPYRATEQRLYALPTLQKKIMDDKERLAELEKDGPKRRSKDIVRFSKAGVRLSDDEIKDALIADLKAKIAADEYEVETVNKALDQVRDDDCYLCLSGRYFGGRSDKEIAGELQIDDTTVWRHRRRLVNRVSVWLYGSAGLT